MRKISLILSFVFLTGGWGICLSVGKVEPAVRNIIYLHVPAAITSLVCMAGVLAGSIQYLRTKNAMWDFSAASFAEAGFIFATILNITGCIFAKAEWGVWWTSSPRLVSSAMLWFLYAGYLLVRNNTDEEFRKKVCAVIGIIASVDVPFVLISARLTKDIHQPGFNFESGWQYAGFAMLIAGNLLLAGAWIFIRTRIFKIETTNR
jgi:heme exporter protein C